MALLMYFAQLGVIPVSGLEYNSNLAHSCAVWAETLFDQVADSSVRDYVGQALNQLRSTLTSAKAMGDIAKLFDRIEVSETEIAIKHRTRSDPANRILIGWYSDGGRRSPVNFETLLTTAYQAECWIQPLL